MTEKRTTAEEAVRAIDSGDTLTISGLINLLCPETTVAAIEERYLDAGAPEDLTVFTPIRVGNEGTGMEHLAHADMVERLVTGSFNTWTQPDIADLVKENEVEAYCLPMGVAFNMLTEAAAGRPGLLTDVGLDTYVDPRRKGGKYNDAATEDLVHVREEGGEEYLFYEAPEVDAAVIRATTADAEGNLTTEREPVDLGVRDMAVAAKAGEGGTVIAQVERVTDCAHGDPRDVAVPGTLVDHVVVDPDQPQILTVEGHDPTLTGEVTMPRSDVEAPDLETRKRIILRRALVELEPDDLINLGDGMAVDLPKFALQQGVFEDVTFTTEHGIVGGIPRIDVFGAHVNPGSLVSSPEHFRFYQGGGLDVSMLGIAQMDGAGNVNNSWFAGTMRGPGGMMDITNRVPRIVFCGSLTAGGLDVSVTDGELSIDQEGKHVKFVEEVEEVTLSGEQLLSKGIDVRVITERGVIDLTESGLELVEVAPGVDVEADVLDQVDCDLAANDPDEMAPSVLDTGALDVSL